MGFFLKTKHRHIFVNNSSSIMLMCLFEIRAKLLKKKEANYKDLFYVSYLKLKLFHVIQRFSRYFLSAINSVNILFFSPRFVLYGLQ